MLDKIIIGAGIYGLYAALFCAKKGQSVVVLEQEAAPFMRATYVNQARVHMGYHYPRSLSTAVKSAGYFKRFAEEFSCCIYSEFKQIYATSGHFSWTDAREFKHFCKSAGIPCRELPVDNYFKEGVCDGAFLTEEYTFDACILRDYLCGQLKQYPNAKLLPYRRVSRIVKGAQSYEVFAHKPEKSGNMTGEERYEAPFVLNASYASVNQVLGLTEGTDTAPFALKYELCEIILCRTNEKLRELGITVMDGPFFSIMPFGKTGFHSLTSVTFTPHKSSDKELPEFSCGKDGSCADGILGNCNTCPARPQSAWEYMAALARKYLKDDLAFEYDHSLFSMKPVLKASEVDDSRPTVIKFSTKEPVLVSVLSGKINTVYDLDEILE